MDAVLIAAGAALIVLVVREVFHTLFHPSGHGGATLLVFRGMWSATGALGARARSLSGPLSMVVVIALWVGVLIIGWALIYLPALPGGVLLAPGLEPSRQDGLLDAVYYSWVTQSTLGYGDIVPLDGHLRILGPLQATLGFGLLTMVVTWVLSIYPALYRQRATASIAHAITSAPQEGPGGAARARQMERLSERLNEVRVDLVQYPTTFYFAAPAPTMSLADALPGLLGLLRGRHERDHQGASAAELGRSLELFTATVGSERLGMTDADADEVVRAYRRHQLAGG